MTRQTVHGNIVAVESYVHLIYHFSTFRRFQHCLCSHIYFSCSHHKQLNGYLEGMTFVMLVAHEEIALISPSWSETCLLLYVHEQLAMSVYLFVFHYYICGYYDVQTTCICIYETWDRTRDTRGTRTSREQCTWGAEARRARAARNLAHELYSSNYAEQAHWLTRPLGWKTQITCILILILLKLYIHVANFLISV